MYYKITNTECDLYKKLHELRTEEKEIDKRNTRGIICGAGGETAYQQDYHHQYHG